MGAVVASGSAGAVNAPCFVGFVVELVVGFVDRGFVDGGFVDGGFVDGGFVDGGFVVVGFVDRLVVGYTATVRQLILRVE